MHILRIKDETQRRRNERTPKANTIQFVWDLYSFYIIHFWLVFEFFLADALLAFHAAILCIAFTQHAKYWRFWQHMPGAFGKALRPSAKCWRPSASFRRKAFGKALRRSANEFSAEFRQSSGTWKFQPKTRNSRILKTSLS